MDNVSTQNEPLGEAVFQESNVVEAQTPPHASSTSLSSTMKVPVEIPRRVSDSLRAKGLEADEYGTVRWAQDSITHPRRWPLTRKVFDTAVICALEFFMTVVSNTGSSIAPHASADLEISREFALVCFTTLYLVGQATGGQIFPPIAESFGGRTIYLSSTVGFSIFCGIMAAFPLLPTVIVGRFVTGLFSALPCVVAAGSIENMWDIKSRTFAIHIWISSAVVGLSLGPPGATYLSTSSYEWPFVFFIASVVTLGLAVVCFGMQESRPSKVLRREMKAIAKKTSFDGLSLEEEDSLPTLSQFVKTSLVLPMRLFFTEPIVFFTSIMASTVYGIIYLFSEALDVVYLEGFGFSIRQGSLVILAISGGVVLSFLCRLYDIRVLAARKRQNQPIEPEDKLFGFYIAAPVLALALWWFAWTVPPLVPGISPWLSIVSLVLLGFSVVEFDNVLSGYLCDAYGTYAASANAPMSFLRAILSGVFPLFGRMAFERLGSNITLSILAGIATAFCGVAVWFALCGKSIRKRSPIAEKTWSANSSCEKLTGSVTSLPLSEDPAATNV